MRITERITWDIETWEILEHEFFEYDGPIDLACGASAGQKAAATSAANLSKTASSQASQIFGADDSVFNQLAASYGATVAAGPSQAGFSENELNAMNSAVVTNSANAARDVIGSTNASMASGGTPGASGTTVNAQTGILENEANQTASGLNAVTQADYAQGNKNYEFAGTGLQNSTNSFNSATNATNAANSAGQANVSAQNTVASANNWWQAPVMGLVNAGLGMATGGLSTAAGMTGSSQGTIGTSSINGGYITPGGSMTPSLGTVGPAPTTVSGITGAI